MRNLRLLALLVPALLLPVACEDDPNAGGTTFNPPPPAGFEAGTTPTPEAGTPEGGVDAGTDAADAFVPPPPVTVTVLDSGLPKNMVRVILHDAAGAVTGDVKTDATGKVTIPVAPSMITVLTSEAGAFANVAPVTFLGVAAGDNLVVTIPPPFTETPVGAYSVPFTAGALTANATSFEANAGGNCYGQSVGVAQPALVDLYPYCLGAQNAVLATAYDAGFIALGFGFAKGVARPAMGATLSVPAIAFTAPGSTKVTASDLPVSANHTYRARLYAIANGAAFPTSNETGDITDPGAGVSYPTATGFAEAYQTYISASPYSPTDTMTQAILRREATTAPALATLPNFDFSTALPLINNATFVAPVPARPDVTLTPAASLAGSDGGVVQLSWFHNASETSGTWTFILPPSTVTFKAPALPADATAFILKADANLSIDDVAFIEATQLPGYKELKSLPVLPGSGLGLVDESRPLPSAGTVRITRRGGGNRS